MRRHVVPVLLATVVVLGGCGSNDPTEYFTIPLKNADIFALTLGDGTVVNLTHRRGNDYAPAWRPDGEAIAFTTDRDGNWEIYVMDPDGAGPTNLTNSLTQDWEATWSPTGAMIAFVSSRDGNPDIYIMNADGTGVQRVTYDEANDWEPNWSPDGTELLFSSDRDGDFEIYRMALPPEMQDVEEPEEEAEEEAEVAEEDPSPEPASVQLTVNNSTDSHPDWSPTGSSIMYLSGRDGGALRFMNADGTDPETIAPTGWLQSSVSWAPDALRVAYARERDVNWPGLYLASATGSERLKETAQAADEADAYPAWSPDGETLLFARWNRDKQPFQR